MAPHRQCCVVSLLPCRAHPYGRLYITPVSAWSKTQGKLLFLWPSKFTLYFRPAWSGFGVCNKTSISRCLSQTNVGNHGHTCKLYDDLLADGILRYHLARSLFPPGRTWPRSQVADPLSPPASAPRFLPRHASLPSRSRYHVFPYSLRVL